MFASEFGIGARAGWRCTCLLMSIFLAKEVQAECVISQGGQEVDVAKFGVGIPNAGRIDPMVPDGTVLKNYISSISGENASIFCPSGIGTLVFSGFGAYDARYKTYPTALAGVGVRMGYSNGTTTDWWAEQRVSADKYYNYNKPTNFAIQFVKTGPITAGGGLGGNFGRIYVPGHGDFLIVGGSNVQIEPAVPTCSLTSNAEFSVPMGSISLTSLQQNGGTSPGKNFNIGLKCSGGVTGSTTRMFMDMMDNSNPSNDSDILTLSQGERTAQGIGIRILRQDGTPVRYSPGGAATELNQWQIGEFGNVEVNIPFSAHYVLTNKVPPTGGAANATATYTISYK
ncbi:fimbrial protein [Pseudomonas aeruginosa]|nr:fimbrial protein [Pseudomonas aeruginosa]